MNDLLGKVRLLYVEDEENLAGLMRGLLEKVFTEFQWASTAEEGLEMFRNNRPDIVLTDITMPGMDGLAMSRIIHEESPDTPIVVLSAYSDKEKLLGAIDVGIVKYFIKPFDPEELLEYLKTLAEKLSNKSTIPIHPYYSYHRLEKTLYRKDLPLSLSQREILFLEALLKKPDHLLDVQSIKRLLWPDRETSDDAVRVFLNRLRNKTGKELIHNRSGEGYYLIPGNSTVSQTE
jgi:DNA-binding response OmpR family regulator